MMPTRQFFFESTWMATTIQSFEVAALTTLLSLLFGVTAAYGIVRGNFPGKRFVTLFLLSPILVPVIVVALGLYLCALELPAEELEKLVTVFTDAQVEFTGSVRPGDRVVTTGRKVFFRRRKLRAEVEMKLEDGTLVCSGVLSGMGVRR